MGHWFCSCHNSGLTSAFPRLPQRGDGLGQWKADCLILDPEGLGALYAMSGVHTSSSEKEQRETLKTRGMSQANIIGRETRRYVISF
jgi:hypothetical protein